MQSGPEFPRIDGAAVILVEAGERFAARFDLLVREGHPHTEAQPRLRPSGCATTRPERLQTFAILRASAVGFVLHKDLTLTR